MSNSRSLLMFFRQLSQLSKLFKMLFQREKSPLLLNLHQPYKSKKILLRKQELQQLKLSHKQKLSQSRKLRPLKQKLFPWMQLTKQQNLRESLEKFYKLDHRQYKLHKRQIESNKKESLPKQKLLDLKLKDLLLRNKQGSKRKLQPKLKGKDLKLFSKLSIIS